MQECSLRKLGDDVLLIVNDLFQVWKSEKGFFTDLRVSSYIKQAVQQFAIDR